MKNKKAQTKAKKTTKARQKKLKGGIMASQCADPNYKKTDSEIVDCLSGNTK